MTLSAQLERLGASFDDVIEALGLPAWLIDASGEVLWLNGAARALGDDRRVPNYISGVAPESRHHVQTMFSRQLLGADETTQYVLTVATPDGERLLIDASNVAVRNGDRVVAVFGVGKVLGESANPGVVVLAPRLHETLRLLSQGSSTQAIATTLGITRESARNYVRLLLRALGAHSRVEAVARGRELELL